MDRKECYRLTHPRRKFLAAPLGTWTDWRRVIAYAAPGFASRGKRNLLINLHCHQRKNKDKSSKHNAIQTPPKKGKRSPYLITERRVPELIPVLGSQPAVDVSHKPGGRLPLLSARPAVTPATNFAAWWTEAQWVWAVCLRLLPDNVATAIWTRALLRLSPAR